IEGHKKTVTALIKSGVNFNVVDNSGWTPHIYALFCSYLNMKDILCNRFQQEFSTEVAHECKYLQNQLLIFVTLEMTDLYTDVASIELNSRAIAIILLVKPYSNYSTLMESITISIVKALELDDIGKIHFEFLIINPFIHEGLTDRNRFTQWKSLSTKVIGHRKTAVLHSAEYVEFDCQLTKDLVLVIYNDCNITKTGIDIPMHLVTLKQFLNLKKIEMEISTNDFNETDSVTSQNSQNSQNDGDTNSTPNSTDARYNSVQAAIRFANFAGLSGIVTNCEPIIEAPGLVKVIKNAGLLLFNYDALNIIGTNTQFQKKLL
ncbi:43679_t:CDS:2, partial [Gigaspora margarita]